MARTKRAVGTALVAVLALGAAACSATGGKNAQETGKADTPRMKIAMITHEAPGDTFWDIVRKGAQAAAAKDNVQLVYSSDPDAGKQATLVQNAIDSKVDGIAVTLAKPSALTDAVRKAQAAGIPVVAFNSGLDDWQQTGALQYFGSDEHLAGESAGKRLAEEGAKHVLCVPQEQGQVALEARCDGVAKGFSGKTTKLYVTGTNMPSVRSTVAAKLKEDPSIDRVVMLGAPFALTAVQSVRDAGSDAKVATFDMNPELVKAVQNGDVTWAVDQQPYLQGYLAIDALWLYKTNGNVIGGGKTTATGPYFVDKNNVSTVLRFASQGTR
ncbi:sugar ABC transporter substrate-binding protein [Actinomadura keratinilytica]|jgi:simple sugar transport system substrate-binding protein|uniref:Sugar ABC transporter substrate-binding protein n=1 Tax=Actinomadura keratinilytica TaxID=547461 RepID=A0ABP7Z9S7_9ACTN